MLRPSPDLVAAHWRRLEAIRAAAVAAVVAQWRTDGVENVDIDATVSTMLAAQTATVTATDAGMALMAGLTTGTPVQPIGLDAGRLIGANARNGVALEQVYGRTLGAARRDGFDRGLEYLRRQIVMDTQLAQRRAANAVVEADRRVVGWRRQINPAPGGKTCGFCVAASTRMYGKRDLLPLHPMCRCSVVAVYSSDPIRGQVIDRERLNAVYARSDGRTDRAGLGRIRFTADDLPAGVDSEAIAALGPRVEWHPEWGPTLTGDRHDSLVTL
jgi:hypothetical protein